MLKVFEYHGTGYFGELALLNNGTRKASIVVTSDEMNVAFLDKACFVRILGDIQDILKRNTELYNKY